MSQPAAIATHACTESSAPPKMPELQKEPEVAASWTAITPPEEPPTTPVLEGSPPKRAAFFFSHASARLPSDSAQSQPYSGQRRYDMHAATYPLEARKAAIIANFFSLPMLHPPPWIASAHGYGPFPPLNFSLG